MSIKNTTYSIKVKKMSNLISYLSEKQLESKIKFIENYKQSINPADGSTVDANANVTLKNISTLETEIMKDYMIQLNQKLMMDKITKLFGKDLADEYKRQVETHEIYPHDSSSLKPYCVSISMYPFLLNGLTQLGGESKAPKNLSSFCGSFINLVFAISSQFAGAVATVEFITYFDYFARREYGNDYMDRLDEIIYKNSDASVTTTNQNNQDVNYKIETIGTRLAGYLQQIVYTINQPAAARNYQSVFWNISIYDQYYFQSMFADFVFPTTNENGEFDKPSWESVKKLQVFFLKWFNEERKKALLTFPVVTCALLTDKESGICKDEEFTDMISKELSEGNSFFMYLSENADSLASCCRLRNEITDKTFSYTLGAGGVATGSINVITINMNRLIQDKRDLRTELDKIHKYQVAYRDIVEDFLEAKLLPVYDAGFITLDKQFLTIGINGMVEAAESQGIQVGYNTEYVKFVQDNLKIIYNANQEASKQYGYKFNTEFVPAENLGVKNAKWDKKDGYKIPEGRDCYNSYFYVVEDDSINPMDKFLLHGRELVDYLDGGSALHLNLDEALTQEGYRKLINVAAKTGCNYFCINVRITICNEQNCQHIDKRTLYRCSKCGSDNVDHATRVIGYLKRVSSFSKGRRKEHAMRHYHIHNKS